MKTRFRISNLFSVIFTALAIAFGLIVLLGYFVDFGPLAPLRQILVNMAVLLAAVAVFVGLGNLVRVHWHKLIARRPGSLYSAVVLIALAVTLFVIVFWGGPTSPEASLIFNYVQVPVEASLLGLLAVVLVYAAIRLFNRRPNVFSVLFLGSALLVLVLTAALPWLDVPALGWLHGWLVRVFAVAGARGILIGVALGTVATGLRILTGADRPYGG